MLGLHRDLRLRRRGVLGLAAVCQCCHKREDTRQAPKLRGPRLGRLRIVHGPVPGHLVQLYVELIHRVPVRV